MATLREPGLVGTSADWMSPEYSRASFQNAGEIFPLRRVRRPRQASPLIPPERPSSIKYGAPHRRRIKHFLRRNQIAGLMLLKSGTVAIEEYAGGADRDTRFLWFSVTKSVFSTLVGAAVAEGRLRVAELAAAHVPELNGTAYRRARIGDLLRMASGVGFCEDDDSPDSHIAEFIRIIARGDGGLRNLCLSLSAERAPGRHFNYSSMDTEVLGIVLSTATQQNVSEYLSQRIWQPMGAESDAGWIVDQPGRLGREVVSGGLCATLPDMARFGRLVSNVDRAGVEVVHSGWWRRALAASGPRACGRLLPEFGFGYGYHWWLLKKPRPLAVAMGNFGQFLIVDRENDLVFVCASAWRKAYVAERCADVLDFFAGLEVENVRRRKLR